MKQTKYFNLIQHPVEGLYGLIIGKNRNVKIFNTKNKWIIKYLNENLDLVTENFTSEKSAYKRVKAITGLENFGGYYG